MRDASDERRRRRKKRPRAAPADAPEPRTLEPAASEPRTLDAQGRERPTFVHTFPADPELERLVSAFERGDYALVRREAAAVAAAAADPAVRRAARELRRRIDPDPLARYLLFVGVALLVVLVAWTYGTPHHH